VRGRFCQARPALTLSYCLENVEIMKIKFQFIIVSACLLTAISCTFACGQGRAGNSVARREVAVTFDDLLFQGSLSNVENLGEMTRKLLKSITSNRVPVFADVNEYRLYQDGKLDPARVALLRTWLDAGAELGNHTYHHMGFNANSLSAVEQDVIRGETITKELLRERGMKLRYFRHPGLWTGGDIETKKAFERFLAERGYTIAPVTVDNNDFIFAAVYAAAKRRGDREAMQHIGEAYIPYMEEMFAFFEKLSVDVVGYEVKQVLLLHANEINADYFDQLVRMMKSRGYTFLTLEQALRDKAYRLPDVQSSMGISWLHRWALAKGMKLREEPREPEFIAQLFKDSQ
jgi:peptidoglycan/xylan/chitin deacetylase (PgdA/CDA1 family)